MSVSSFFLCPDTLLTYCLEKDGLVKDIHSVPGECKRLVTRLGRTMLDLSVSV